MKIKAVPWQKPGNNETQRRHLWFNSLLELYYQIKMPHGKCQPWSQWKGHNPHSNNEGRKKKTELTSVNCWGQIPTLSPSLASIQCSSTRRMTVRMSPCKPELSKGHTERTQLREKVMKRWEADKTMGGDVARWLWQSALAQETEHCVSSAACDINPLCVCRARPFCSQPSL